MHKTSTSYSKKKEKSWFHQLMLNHGIRIFLTNANLTFCTASDVYRIIAIQLKNPFMRQRFHYHQLSKRVTHVFFCARVTHVNYESIGVQVSEMFFGFRLITFYRYFFLCRLSMMFQAFGFVSLIATHYVRIVFTNTSQLVARQTFLHFMVIGETIQ